MTRDSSFLQILGAGYGRTGTTSLRTALNLLGFKTHHMTDVILDSNQKAEIFEEAYKDRTLKVDWGSVYEGYEAAVDWPSVAFFDTLYQLNPDAKVILSVRDPESWYKSVSRTIYEWPGVDDSWPQNILKARKMARVIVRDGELGGQKNIGNKEGLIKQFKDHTEHIKSVVKPENLLIFELGTDGWEKLCPFLGIAEPKDVPYPHDNKGANFADLLQQIKEISIGR
ncbi:P-loop containing nucleoside triphosphate hydrolase protein [Thamnidium elegans]|nr:P-loop containing nucleoside triphosphate hydrolase protein [Thamnidium elegans]KAI8047009.1 P-loop containing nucleoside triphosphate hydrolase protein [Thamnidium elegans]KAI8047010.1 P-loop containing nucleoside triphosphate hydrolase protein [Thamnidium elegans]KAI8047065.1 P-loop containing nucleoside triphosphate hydrolase protein [Thamnidium elegans]KAI8047066.1 P-loop containing nucleoside triphosphate hydrolase protein [Thamnidium elegans]